LDCEQTEKAHSKEREQLKQMIEIDTVREPIGQVNWKNGVLLFNLRPLG